MNNTELVSQTMTHYKKDIFKQNAHILLNLIYVLENNTVASKYMTLRGVCSLSDRRLGLILGKDAQSVKSYIEYLEKQKVLAVEYKKDERILTSLYQPTGVKQISEFIRSKNFILSSKDISKFYESIDNSIDMEYNKILERDIIMQDQEEAKEHYDAEVEFQAEIIWNKLYSNQFAKGSTFLERLTNKSIERTIMLFKESPLEAQKELKEQWLKNSYKKNNKMYTNLYIGGKLMVAIESTKLGVFE